MKSCFSYYYGPDMNISFKTFEAPAQNSAETFSMTRGVLSVLLQQNYSTNVSWAFAGLKIGFGSPESYSYSIIHWSYV